MILPVTAPYAAFLGFLHLFLTFRVIGHHRSRRVDMGTAGNPLLERYVRAHGNFAEHVPLALLLTALVELQGWPALLVHAMGLSLLAGRLAHAWAFSVAEPRLPSRTVGMVLTISPIAAGSLLLLAGLAG